MEKYQIGQKIIVELNNGDIYRGDYVGGDENRIDVSNITECNSCISIEGILSYYKNEISRVRLLKSKKEEREVPLETGNCENVALITSNEYQRLKAMPENNIYVDTISDNYYKAVVHLNSCENIGLFLFENSSNNISLLTLATWDQVYVFDIKLLQKIPKEIKQILIGSRVKKIVYNFTYTAKCIYSQYSLKLSNIFDIQVSFMFIFLLT